MMPRRTRALAAALLVVATAAAPAGGHPFDLASGRPASYAAIVHWMREEVVGVEQSRRARDFVDLRLRATRLATLAGAVPGFALTLESAVRDSAVGQILQSSARIGFVTKDLDDAAQRADTAAVAEAASRFADLVAVLDAYAPKQYVCPMHCETGRVYDRPGLCPVCNMHLQLISSDRYSVEVAPVSGALRAKAPVTLGFQIRDPAGFEATHLQVVHEKLLHLMIVSDDLSRFAHVHPEPGEKGAFTLRHRFPTGGRYFLFHDFTPDSVGMQVVPVELTVEGPSPARAPLVVDDRAPKRVDGYEVALSHTRLAPDIECSMTFTLTRNGRPVTDLEPFLGAAGHLVMISEDRAAYVHSHPLDQKAAGPSVEFKMSFARTGIYKAWGQFQRRGRVLTFPFVVQVSVDEARGESIGGTTGSVP